MGERVDVAVESVRVRLLHMAADPAVKLLTHRVGHALVCDVAGRDVTKDVLRLRLEGGNGSELAPGQVIEARADRGLAAELGRAPPHPGVPESPADDARHLECGLLSLAEAVDPRHDHARECVRDRRTGDLVRIGQRDATVP